MWRTPTAAWTQLRMPDLKYDKNGALVPDKLQRETNRGFYRGGPSVLDDPNNPGGPRLIRVPYAFATDHWADTGNVSVFRHDNGADPYEQVMFLITTQENRHIFDNFRRSRTSFSVRAAADRSFSRYSEKMLGISGGIGFYGSIYQDLAENQGLSFDTLWPVIVDGSLKGNILSATVAFDHVTRQLSRPEAGVHYYRAPVFSDPVLHSDNDADDYGAGADVGINPNTGELVLIPNGATGYLRDISFAGHPLSNALSSSNGDYDSEYTENAGSYYEKINTAILLSTSEDRFISQSRRDFYDARFRAIGMADVLPDGYRRVLEFADPLTGRGYALDPAQLGSADGAYGVGFNAHGRAVVLHFADGTAVVKPDPAVQDLDPTGTSTVPVSPCDPDPSNGNQPTAGCKPLSIFKNHHAYQLASYKTVPDYLHAFGAQLWTDGHVLGQYP